jgi:putative sterol carrier protein
MFGPTVDEMAEAMRSALPTDPVPSKSIRFDLHGAGSILVKDGRVTVTSGEADLVLTLNAPTLFALATGAVSPLKAYMAGELQINDMSLMLQLTPKVAALFSRIAHLCKA